MGFLKEKQDSQKKRVFEKLQVQKVKENCWLLYKKKDK